MVANSPAFALTLAHFSPLPPQRSGIAAYSNELLPYLAELATIETYVDDPSVIDPKLVQRWQMRAIREFWASAQLRQRYDACLYHMGNHPLYHEEIYRTLLRQPGIVVLHEVELQGFHIYRPQPPTRAFYVREMGYAYGQDGLQIARSLEINGPPAQLTYPLFNRIADISLGIIVHTRQARDRILAEVPQARVAAIPLAVTPFDFEVSRPRPVALQTQSAETVFLASFGYIASSKRIEQVLRALAPLRTESTDWRYVLIGAVVEPYQIEPLIQQLGLSDRVRLVGFVDESEFDAYLQHIDIGLNLRSAPSGGEMSASLMRLLSAGRPTLVSNIGGFSELPAECVVKIDQDDGEIGQLTEQLRRLINDPTLRRAYGTTARNYVQTTHSYASVAKQYIEFIQESLAMAAHAA